MVKVFVAKEGNNKPQGWVYASFVRDVANPNQQIKTYWRFAPKGDSPTTSLASRSLLRRLSSAR